MYELDNDNIFAFSIIKCIVVPTQVDKSAR